MDWQDSNSSEDVNFLETRAPEKELTNHCKSLKMVQDSQMELEKEVRNFSRKFGSDYIFSTDGVLLVGQTLQGTTTLGILESIRARNSSCTVEISNRLSSPLDEPKYFSYGACRSPMPARIPAFTIETFGFSDTPGDCTRGVCSYRIEGTNVRIAIMYSIMFSSFALGFVDEETSIDYAFYYNARKREDWNERRDKKRGLAHTGAVEVKRGNFLARATMTDSVKALIKLELSCCADEE